ncbi:MAG: relaxase/mobilization nuclease domain-containing protein [Oscillospiraceae bacterium]|nr:relaxase/mobilization nuclease domain-containing protein [Oscillospiraceae bacterium]
MPYIKVISIGNSVAGCLKYIANPDKTDEQNYLSSLNCSDDIFVAEQEFCLTYQHYSHKNFYSVPNKNGKSPVKAFHIIQSFKAGECAADIAHKIGLEWVQSVFGKNFQAVICTHTDRENIHNHICLCPYDLDGIKFNSNKKSLEHIRKISDEICRNYGICEMEKLTSDKKHIPVGTCYGEWKHRKFGTSWKEFIRRKIDYLIKNSADLNDLLFQLEQQDFVVKRGKYISVKAPEQQRFVRLKTLGANYSEESISRRILDLRPKIKSLDEIISEVIKEFTFETRKFSFAQSVKDATAVLANQLSIINGEGLSSITLVENKLSEIEKEITDTQLQINKLEVDKNSANEIISAAERYFKKYSVFKKSTAYPKTKRQEDKALLAKYGIKSLDDVAQFRENIQEYSKRIAVLQSQICEIQKKEDDYKSIIETYKNCSEDDYISRLVKAARDKMNRQETAKLKALREESYTVYSCGNNNYLPFKQLDREPNVDDYVKKNVGSWFDVEGDNIGDKLENIYQGCPDMVVGDVIVVKAQNREAAFYVNDYGFIAFEGFMKSRSEQLRQKQLQEEKQKTTAAKKRSR